MYGQTNCSMYSIRNLLRVCLFVLLIKTEFSPRSSRYVKLKDL